MKKKQPNQALVNFAVEANARGMTYGQLQQLETMEKLKRQEYLAEKKKKGGKR